MVQYFVNITGFSKNNLVQVDKKISEIQTWINNTKQVIISTRLISTFALFLHNFQMIYLKVDEIETAIAFSKLGTKVHQYSNTSL